MEKKAINRKTWIIIGVVVVLLAVLGVGGYFISRGGAGRDESLLELGQRYLEELNYEQAIVCFEEYLEIDPKSVEAYAGLAQAYVGLGEYEKALEVLAEGYAVTGDGSLRELGSQFEKQYAEVIASQGSSKDGGNADGEMANEGTAENNAADAEEVVYEDGHDPRFEACVVDGIYHNGYEYYDLTPEEEEYLQSIIDQAQQENIDEVFSLLGGDELIALLQNHEAYKEDDDHSYGSIYIAFYQYKIYCTYGSTNDRRLLTLIPLEEGNGYYFNAVLGTMNVNGEIFSSKNRHWTISDCENGMFNGQFVKYSKSETLDGNHLSIDVSTGNVINGLIDGAVIRHSRFNIYENNYENWYRSDYVLGQVNVYEEKVVDGRTTCYYEYGIDENGDPILNNEGGYASKSGISTTKEEMDAKRWSVDGGNSSGHEKDGGMWYYLW